MEVRPYLSLSFKAVLMGCLLTFHLVLSDPNVEAETVKEAAAEESDGGFMLSFVDIVLLILAGAAVIWYFTRESESDRMPDYEIKPMVIDEAPQAATEKGFLAKMKKTKRRLVVFYGSQTGTAEEFAGRLAKEGAKYGMKGLVADPEEEDMDQLSQVSSLEGKLGPCIAVFMLATYGEGDPTDNCMEFHEKLKDELNSMYHLNFAVFGLGNKTYEHFNAMAKYADRRLSTLGGNRVHPLGLGDDDGNLEEDFITWKEGFWNSVCKEFNIEATGEEMNSRQYDFKVLTDDAIIPDKLYRGEIARLRSYETQRPPYDVKNPFLAPIFVNKNLHKAASGRHCMHIELEISNSRLRYDAGDHVAVYPTNNQDLVNRIGELLNINLDTVFTMTNLDEDSSKKHPFPCPTTYRTALLHYVDIVVLPRTHILKELARYTTNEEEKAKLEKMSGTSTEGKELYQNWIINDCRHLVHILEDLPSCKPPIDHLFELLPRLQPRFYSIASSAKVHPTSVHICAVVVEYKTPTGRTNKGVATTWLREKQPTTDKYPTGPAKDLFPQETPDQSMKDVNPKVPVFIRRSTFRVPNRPQLPVIMIGPGTGVAPFIGFIQERDWQRDQGKPVGPTLLFFGCRKRDEDYIYQEQLEEFVKKETLELYTAFSRDQAEKRYVTHLLKENGDRVWELLAQSGHVYICGDAKMMAKDVRNTMLEIFQVNGGLDLIESEKLLKRMESQKRYSADVWS